jgi:hypothetical protein
MNPELTPQADNPLLRGPDLTEIRRKYAHFQRLMSELMWDGLVGKETPVQGVRTLWVYQDKEGNDLRHELHLPKGELFDEQPVYNRYHKAFYFLEDAALLEGIKTRLAELAKVQLEAKALAGLPPTTTSRHLLFPELRERITTVRFWRKEKFSSHRRTKEQVLNLLRRELADKKQVTQQKYEPQSFGDDPVLRARYGEIAALEKNIELVKGLEHEHYRERTLYQATVVYLYDDQGRTEQLDLHDVGLVVAGKNVQVFDMDKETRKRRVNKRSLRPEPLLRLDGVDLYTEAGWQAFKGG